MTPEELDAIRARDAASRSHTPGDMTYTTPTQRAAYDDRRALLAEVDRLTQRMRDEQDGAAYLIAYDYGVTAERARIRAAVDGLDFECPFHDRAAVLAAIDGGGA